MKRFYVLSLWFMLGLSVDFCYAGKGVKRLKPDSSDSIAIKTLEASSPKQKKVDSDTSLEKDHKRTFDETSSFEEPQRCNFRTADDYYIHLADYYGSTTEDLQERFGILIKLINITKRCKYSAASDYILGKLREIISSIEQIKRFDFLANFIEENYCVLDERKMVALSYAAYINQPYGVWIVMKKLLLKLRSLTEEQSQYARERAKQFYEDAKKYRQMAL